MGDPVHLEDEEFSDHDLLIEIVGKILKDSDVTGPDILQCIEQLGRVDLIEEAQEMADMLEEDDESIDEESEEELAGS